MIRVALGLALLLAACGGGDPATPVECADVFADGVTTDADAMTSEPCADDEGEATFVVALTYDCDDGRQAVATDYGWGYEGERWRAGEGFDVFAECNP